jgi:hypothetical protein
MFLRAMKISLVAACAPWDFASDFSSGFWLSFSSFAFSSGFWLLASGFLAPRPSPSRPTAAVFRHDRRRITGPRFERQIQ